MKFIGYARIDNDTQQESLQKQFQELKLYTKEQFFDVYHGNDFKAPELSRILMIINPNMTLIVPELKTITNNFNELLRFIHLAQLKNYNFIALKENLNTNKDDGKLTLQIINDLYQTFFNEEDIKHEKKKSK